MNKKVNQKSIILMILIITVIGIVFSFLIYRNYYSIKKIDANNYINDDSIVVKFDEVDNEPEEKIVSIKGWAIKQNQDLKTVETYVALKSIDTSEVFKISTIKQDRNDITKFFKKTQNDDHNYDKSGFLARVDKNAIKYKGQYEICILYLSDKNNDLIPTGKFIEIN